MNQVLCAAFAEVRMPAVLVALDTFGNISTSKSGAE